jgi:hypothetical protein
MKKLPDPLLYHHDQSVESPKIPFACSEIPPIILVPKELPLADTK